MRSRLRRSIDAVMTRLDLKDPLLQAVSSRYRAERNLATLLAAEIRRAGFDEIAAAYSQDARAKRTNYHDGGVQNSVKYLDLEWTVATAVREANRLQLLGAPPRRVLDLGCGTGCFLYVLRHAGHDVVGLDIDTYPIFDEMIRLLGIPRLTHRIARFEPLPDTGAAFDVITAYSVCFDCHSGPDVWRVPEWTFFVEDCRRRLRPGGRLCLQFNPATQQPFDYIPDDVAAMMRAMPGATLSANKEVFVLTV